ncbi:unnamed protein product [Vitrella brassicaformis CCMP3155]|uniref:Protein kinase domain-containing protein n=1 Tax=Vitrella brassicaformis (strain CCMP3155) TaxID=1169540 RepID=A0A0G4F4J0_VITBC|nr:unnamed protein product [Vitrella brassicaformis CCMP3155]|eukprot:CEM06972.1 unnamed protein product [Vitrella brassicaformis CCMP3155]
MASPVPRLLIKARDLTVSDKKLGGGAFGTVYQGKWKGLDVAVKITNMEELREASPLTGEELTETDALSEAQEMQHLRHPNIVQFLGVCMDAKHGLMIVTELCQGGSLDKYLVKNRPLPLDVRDRFVREICEGVQYLHNHGILHRDLKPGNILLGEHLVIKISDFGMTRNVQTPRIPDSLPEHIKSAIKSCFAFKPKDRPTAKELLTKLGMSPSPSKETEPVLVPPASVSRLLIRARNLAVMWGKKLGGEAFGTVYQGKWKGLDVAVKITNMEKLREASSLTGEELTETDALFEAQEMQHLRYPNIVQFLGVCMDAKHGLMIVTELCQGGSLDRDLVKNRPLPLDVRDRFVREICEGVQYLHNHGILHRDLKPGNILLGEHLVIKISDFGMTRNVQVTSSSSAGSKRHGMAECGGPPFEGQAPLTIITAVVVRKQTPRIPDFLPEHIKSAIKSCFAFKPEDRPTAKELLAKLGIPASPSKSADPVLVPPSPVSPVDVPSAGAPPGVHTSMVSTVPGPPSTVHPAQVELVVAEEQTALPTQQPSVKTPPSAPQPQIKHADIFDAVRKGDEQSVHLLIEREGKDILDKRDNDGVWNRDDERNTLSGLSVWSRSRTQLTPFLWAANKGHVGVMSVMYESKVDVLQQTDQFGNTAMHLAANRGHVAMVNKLLEWDPKLIDARTPNGITPFIWAAWEGHVDVMEAMYESKPDVLKQTDKVSTQTNHPVCCW